MAKHWIELLIDSIPRKKSFWTKGRAVAAVSIMSQLIAFAATKRPSLAPLQTAITALLAPSESTEPDETPSNPLLARIRELRGRMAVANAVEQEKLKAQVEVLIDLATENA